MAALRIGSDEVLEFARWSHDVNPLHVDEAFARRSFFGRPIVHGMLGVVRAIAGVPGSSIGGIDVEFRGAVFCNEPHELRVERIPDGERVTLGGAHPALIVRLHAATTDGLPPAAWATQATGPTRPTPADRTDADFTTPLQVLGCYAVGDLPDGYRGGRLTPSQVKTLALCSYLVGMEAPGLRSLFTRAQVRFAGDAPHDVEALRFRLTVDRYDGAFRILTTSLDVATDTGAPVASVELRSYVRLNPIAVPVTTLAARLAGATPLAGKVALVTGGTRGLGADISSALALAGATVFATYRADRSSAHELVAQLTGSGVTVHCAQVDAASEDACRALVGDITRAHGGIDVLVLNACAPPPVLKIGAETTEAQEAYLRDNIALVQRPLSAALPSLATRRGVLVGISSSFVEDAPAGFGHYVALKHATESLLNAVAIEQPTIRVQVVRPPRLQTAWNDTPTGVLGTIPADYVASHLVDDLVEHGAHGQVRVRRDFPAPATPVPPVADAAPDVTVAIAAAFTADPIDEGLRFWFRELGVAGQVVHAPYGQVMQSLLDPGSVFNANRRGLNVVLLRSGDWLRELPPSQAGSPEFVATFLAENRRELERALTAHRAQAAVETLLLLAPEAPDLAPEIAPLVAAVAGDLAEHLRGLPGLRVQRAAAWHERYGVAESEVADTVRDHLAHIPYRTPYFHTLATIVVRAVHLTLQPAKKVIVVDCDNTLWKGVVGEVGPEGLAFEASHRALHATLVRLVASGMLLCLCSKNEEADVWRAFDECRDLGVRRDAIVAAMVNWMPKSENIRAIGARLNLGLDSMIFLDDNPVECAEVRSGCPEVLTLQWPTDADAALRLLDHTWEFDRTAGTQEDVRRTQMYQEEFERQGLQAQLAFGDFIKSLDLHVDLAAPTVDDVKRASQMTLRTNQFNFTTIRRDESEMASLVTDGRHDVLIARVRDRFGDYGIVGLLIAEARGPALVLDTFLLSCRVLGRGVEHRLASELGRLAEQHGCTRVEVTLRPTRRNTPARIFLDGIAPGGRVIADADGILTCAFTPGELIGVRFDPADKVVLELAELAAADAKPKSTGEGVVVERLRARESQIGRAASVLATQASLDAIISGRPANAEPQPLDASGIEGSVYRAFASALGLDVDEVRRLDELEALGCDSFKIVEITVDLLARFPTLPSTLLFEHRTVSDIAAAIVAMSSNRGLDASPPRPPRVRASGEDDLVAVVGMGVRCAGVDSPEDFWRLLSRGESAVARVAPDRSGFLHELRDDRPHFAGLLGDVAGFEPEVFGISPREAELMDPQLRLFLEVAWAALEDAGNLGDDMELDTGVFVGAMYADYAVRANLLARSGSSPYKSWEHFSLANRLSATFEFAGPSLAIDTACSSSMTALHLARRALLAGDCRVAVVGGVNLILDPDRFVQLGRLGILSMLGRCLAFGAESDGTVLGEGAAVVVLRRLDDALERGDRIIGVIRSSGVSTGSGTVGFTAPNPTAQAVAIHRAVEAARIDPRTVTYVETHGTGTALGDPIEVRGLSLAYGDPALQQSGTTGQWACSIGSVKPNVGHLEAGAGVLSLVKVLLQLVHGMRVPSITSELPNPQIPFAQGPFSIQRTLAPWPRPELLRDGVALEAPRRAGVSSFGVGGANVHVIVEEPTRVDRPATVPRAAYALAVSGRTDSAVIARARELARYIDDGPDLCLADLCHSNNVGRRHFDRRIGLAVESIEAARRDLRAIAGGAPPPCAFVARPGVSARNTAWLFTGQGSQFPGVAGALYESEPVFRDAIDRCAERLDPGLPRPLLAVLFAKPGSDDAALLDQTGFTQPALFAIEYAFSTLWQSWGLEPSAVLGHSVGEVPALTVAGGLCLDDGLTLIAARGRLMQQLPAGGAMLSVMADEARVRAALTGFDDRVSIGALNGPTQVVISGAGDAVLEIQQGLAAAGVRSKLLQVSHAFHSPLMRPMVDEFLAVVRTLRFTPTRIPFVSAVEGRILETEFGSPDYWSAQVLAPVQFTRAMQELERVQTSAYLEVGPQPILTGMAKSCLGAAASDRAWAASSRKDADGWQAVSEAAAALYAAGATIDWRAFDATARPRRISLPPYPFQRRPFWIEGTASLPQALDRSPGDGRAGAAAYVERWVEAAALPSRDGTRTPGTWILLADRGAFADAVAAALRTRGATCVVVAPRQGGEVAGLDAALTATGDIAGLIHAWGMSHAVTDPASGSRLVVHATATLAKHLGQAPGSTRVWFVTSGAVWTPADGDGATLSVPQASAWGTARTLSLEMPDRVGGIIDLDASADVATQATGLVQELLAGEGDDQVALRAGGRFVPRLQRDSVAAQEPVPGIRGDGAYLVTGATGALGARLARWLVAQGARHLVLTSRRGDEAPGAVEFVKVLRDSGATVDLIAADLAVEADVHRVLAHADRDGTPLVGIFHAAGVDRPVATAQLSAEDIDDVIGAKAQGAWWLDRLTRDRGLDTFVMFSSMSATLGSSGRAPYAAANAILDAIARERRAAGHAALSVQWGPWAGGGMATHAQLDEYRRVGNVGLDPDAALALLPALMAGDAPVRFVADIDWPTFVRAYEARRPRPIMNDLKVGSAPARADESSVAPWLSRLAATPADERPSALRMLIRSDIASLLRLQSADEVGDEHSFFDLGMDSLSAAEFAAHLERALGLKVTSLVFDHPSLDALAAHMWPVVAEALSTLPREDATDALVITQPAQVAEPGLPTEALVGPATAQAGTDRVITGYAPGIEDEVIVFQAQAWPHRRRDWLGPRWTWMFHDSARRLGREPQVWLYRDGATIVGHNGAIAVDVKVGNDYLPSAWLVDTMVLEAYRSQAAGSRLMVQAHEDLPFALSLGQTDQMRQILLRLGWRQVGPQHIAMQLVRPERVLRGKVPAAAASVVGLGLRATMAVRDVFRRRAAGTVRAVERFTERHDALWAVASRDLTCAVRRDASYLNWKYVDQPGQDFLRLEYLEDGELRGIAVWMFRDPEGVYRYRRGFLVDIVVPLHDTRLVADMLSVVREPAVAQGADALLCHHINPQLSAALMAAGYRLRDPQRFFLVRPEGLAPDHRALLTDPAHWFVTHGDSDIDRPW